jgi:pilus assembly protein CpaF
MSFAIIISEKGGAERRELFEKNEISVGRVQGNDLMLPKGNVSKRHAKLMFRDGRFIVADLRSTNGTYVNGRKIAQATIVREGDKIYVGDFVLRFEAAPGVVLAPESAATAPGPRDATAAELGQPSSVPQPLNTTAGPRDAVSHYPLENDPDEAVGASPRVVVPSPPRIPSGLSRGGGTQMLGAMPPLPSAAPPTESSSSSIAAAAAAVVAQSRGHGGATHPAPPALQPPSPLHAPPGHGGGSSASHPSTPGHPASTTSPPHPSSLPTPSAGRASGPGASAPIPATDGRSHPSGQREPRSREAAAQAAHRLALATLVDRVGEMIDIEPLRDGAAPEPALSQRVERATREQAQLLRQDGEIPDGVDVEALGRDALRELLGLGPLATLLDDDDVSVVHVPRFDTVVVTRGHAHAVVEPPFSSEDSLRRALARLCVQAGQPLAAGESIVERRLARGSMLAVLPPLAVGAPW